MEEQGQSEHQRTREPPPYLRLVFSSTGAYNGSEDIRRSLLAPRPESKSKDANYMYTVVPWDPNKKRFPPVCFGRSSSEMAQQFDVCFKMKDEEVSRVQACFELKVIDGGKLEIHFKNLGSFDLRHIRGNETRILGPNSQNNENESTVLARDDQIEFYTSKSPLRMRCDLNTESKKDPLKTGFTVAVEQITRSIAPGQQDDVLEVTPMQAD